VKISDLGLAAIVGKSHAAHSIIGTPEYMAPKLYEDDFSIFYKKFLDLFVCLLFSLDEFYIRATIQIWGFRYVCVMCVFTCIYMYASLGQCFC